MKKITIITGLTCLATIGSVFGAWVFGEKTVTQNFTFNSTNPISVETNIINFGTANVEIDFNFDKFQITQHDVDGYKLIPYTTNETFMKISCECDCEEENPAEFIRHEHQAVFYARCQEEGKLDQYFNLSNTEKFHLLTATWSTQEELETMNEQYYTYSYTFATRPLEKTINSKEEVELMKEKIAGDKIILDIVIDLFHYNY